MKAEKRIFSFFSSVNEVKVEYIYVKIYQLSTQVLIVRG